MDHLSEDIVIQPRKGKNERDIPRNGLLLVNPSEAQSKIENLAAAGGERRFLFNSELCIASGKEPFFVAGPAIGAPMAAMTLEKLIALGAKKIILCGWCGSLSKHLKTGSVIVPDMALSGEGTSQYYTGVGDTLESTAGPIRPDTTLSDKLAHELGESGITVNRGCIWSTDAVYRENRTMLRELASKNNVSGVDMEFSALCSVAAFREIAFAAVLIVSDEIWGTSWRPGFSSSTFKEAKERTLSTIFELIGKI